tara:strand:+ start:27 stop:230 length:204 start_codon:yes stop_codon:yes gene_type:complete
MVDLVVEVSEVIQLQVLEDLVILLLLVPLKVKMEETEFHFLHKDHQHPYLQEMVVEVVEQVEQVLMQ